MKCAKENDSISDLFKSVEIRNDGLYTVTCSKGHTDTVALQEQKFEILFEIGAHAILEGYYREAVSSFTASLERFYEFYIKIISLKHNISEQQFNGSWQKIERQSERQLGAFIFAYTLENKNIPPLLSNKNREFRNKVIHKGKIPYKKEAIQYGNSILQSIRPILQDLKTHYRNYVNEAVGQYVKQLFGKAEQQITSTMTINTIISIVSADTEDDTRPLEKALQQLPRRR